ncbi:hypothetical protein ACHAW5_005527 [Stephanodiscus triporus]|uniref:Cation-transporting P-type ATPase N-terminal domain-containing protein n=1 Tax=Stephanodiscus triporus TaxID=2934178 RepID=A0ABD3NLR1_9STRA
MKVVFGVVAFSAASGVFVPCVAGSSSGRRDVSSSLWHAMDGIPILMDRRRPARRKMSVNNQSAAHPKGVDDWPGGEISYGRFLAFGDYVDPSYSCPATVTCPDVCVASVDYCPEDAVCPGTHPDDEGNPYHEYELCVDGTCADLTAGEACDSGAESPCPCGGLPFVCAKQVGLLTDCSLRFQEQYDANELCLANQKESLPSVSFGGPWFVACYVALAGVTALMLIWCAWNQRWAPIPGSTVPLECAKVGEAGDGGSATMGAKKRSDMMDKEVVEMSAVAAGQSSAKPSSRLITYNDGEEWTQTGYRSTVVGMTLYSSVILVHVIIQFLLLALSVEYYVQQEAITWSIFGSQVFFDEVQVLLAFEITWMVGFVWCFFLKFPASIHSLFLRRCVLEDAHYVAVSATTQSFETHYENKLVVKLMPIVLMLYSDMSQNPAEGLHNQVTYCKVRVDRKTGSRYFYFRFRRYIHDFSSNKFIPGCWNVHQDTTIREWLDRTYLYHGLSNDEAIKRLGVAGPNVLDLKKPTIVSSIISEFSQPFYLYQNFLVWTWAPFWYYYMFIVNSIIRLTGGLVVAVFEYMSDKDLYQLMSMKGTVQVLRGGDMITIDQTEVVPGDIVRLVPGEVYCDMAILQATKVLVDESSLTGEVHPIAKRPLDPANSHLTYNMKENKTSTLSAGTTILECGDGTGTEGDLAIVTKTGSFTAKGELLSDVLSYERHKFKFDDEVKIVLAILVAEALVLVALVCLFIKDDLVYSWFYAMYVVGTVLPPLLPTVFVVSVGISCKRLQGKRITCTDSRGILVAGKVKKAFFDKTGTLTKQGLEFHYGNEKEQHSPLFKRGIAVCQTLHLSNDGSLIGPAVDRIGFEACSAKMVDENTVCFEGEDIKYLKRFDFDHHRMTQSVIVKHREEAVVYVKGSPESISKLCMPSSLPSDFFEKAKQSARGGIYQLAIATKAYTSAKGMHEVTRDDIEKDLEFVGFINFQNSLKEESSAVIDELRRGAVDCVMITGDNVLTGIYIAMQAGIIEPDRSVVIGNSIQDDGRIEWLNYTDDSPAVPSEGTCLALTGEVWEYLLSHDPKSALNYAKHTQVFGRCTPNDKVSIVSTFVEIGDITLMCGDGGNDCGALKAAHVGIALSDAEASVVAPFTSLDKSITSVTEVVREGRCALASAIASYKYMIMYGQVESINQVINAYLHVTFSEWCWVFMDGIWTTSMAFSLPLAKAAKELSAMRPTASILGLHTISSACGILAINFVFLVIALIALWVQDWYQCRKWDSTDVSNVTNIVDNYESSVIFIVSGYQYISSAAAFNFGYSFRENWFRNYVFAFLFILFTSMQFGMTLSAGNFSCIWRVNCDNDHAVRSVTSSKPEPINNVYSTTVMPAEFRWLLVGLMVANLILNCAWDYYVVNKAICRRDGKKLEKGSQHADLGVKYSPPVFSSS